MRHHVIEAPQPVPDREAALCAFAHALIQASEHDAAEWHNFKASPHEIRVDVIRRMAAMPRTKATMRAIEAAEFLDQWAERHEA